MVLQSLDAASNALFGYDDVVDWPAGTLEALTEAGVLSTAQHARSVICDGCDEACREDLEFVEGHAGGLVRAYVVCRLRDDIGRVAVPLERLQRWAVDPNALAKVLAELVNAYGAVEELVRDRLWWLGQSKVRGRRVDVFLAVGAARPDADRVLGNVERVKECSSPLILVPWDSPLRSVFGIAAKALSLARLLTFEDGSLCIDRPEIEKAIGKEPAKRTQDVVPFPTPDGLTWQRLLIEFQNDEVVKIEAGSVVDHKTFADMGFADRRKKSEEPDKLWVVFRVLAKEEGRIRWGDDSEIPPAQRENLKTNVSDIRKRLRAYFPTIPGDPFKPYRKVKAYETKFVLRWLDSYRRPRR